MKTVIEEIETAVAAVVPHPITAAPQARMEVKPAVVQIVDATITDSYPSCLDLAAEFMARG
jgi:hypothetical protein